MSDDTWRMGDAINEEIAQATAEERARTLEECAKFVEEFKPDPTKPLSGIFIDDLGQKALAAKIRALHAPPSRTDPLTKGTT